jgi:hypothetical protein
MFIKLNKVLKPFSHLPGEKMLLPSTNCIVKAFPTALFIDEKKLVFDLKGPVQGFTVFDDLEKNRIIVQGRSENNYYRFYVFYKDGKVNIFVKKLKDSIICNLDNETITIKAKDTIAISLDVKCFSSDIKEEKLFLGINKKQDWQAIQKREDLKEFLPFWFFLGQKIKTNIDDYSGVASSLVEAEDLINKKDKVNVEKVFEKIFYAGFEGILVPKLKDDNYLGLGFNEDYGDPNILLNKGYELIRLCFFKEDEDKLSILPNLLVSCHSGMLFNINTSFGFLDLIWAKKQIKKIRLFAKKNASFSFDLDKSIKSFRIRKSIKEKGSFISKSDEIVISANKTYFFDRFQK